ncbi:hypothetical protein PM082_017803 [Marasmius tenuissimus]|nr:hypothetical protein PM082_017803 [Marasmius tenuissimus]
MMGSALPTIFTTPKDARKLYNPVFESSPNSVGFLSRRIWGSEENPYFALHAKDRHPETRREEVHDVLHWVRTRNSSSQHAPVLWIHGGEGVGKSVLSQAIFAECYDTELVSSFFFSTAHPTTNTSAHFVRTILYNLVDARPELRRPVSRAFSSNPTIWDAPLEVQFKTLIVDTFQSTSFVQRLDRVRRKKPDLILLDGLDEMDDAERILDMILSGVSEGKLPLRFIISTQNNTSFTTFIDTHIQRSLIYPIGINPRNTNRDIRTYLRSCFSEIPKDRLDPELFPTLWPSHEDYEAVVQYAQGRFLYASMFTEAIKDENEGFLQHPLFLLRDILDDTRANGGQQSPFDCLLRYILFKGSQDRYNPDAFKALLLSVLLFRFTRGAASPLFMEHFWGFSSDLSRTPTLFLAQLGTLRYMVNFGSINGHIHFLHSSIVEFLHDPARAGPFYIDELQSYHTLVHRWIRRLVEWQADEETGFNRHAIIVLWEQWGTFITSSRVPDETVLSHLLELDLSVLFNRALSILLAGFRPFHALFRNLKMVADWLEDCELSDAKHLYRRFMNAQQTLHVRATISPTVKDDLLTWVIFDLAFCKYASNSTNRAQHSVRASASNIAFVAVGEDCTCFSDSTDPESTDPEPTDPDSTDSDSTDPDIQLLHLDIRDGYTVTLDMFVKEMNNSNPRLLANRGRNRALIFNILGSSLLSLCGPNRDLLPLCHQTIEFSKMIRGRFQYDKSGIVAEEYAGCKIATLQWLKSFGSDKDRHIRDLIRSLDSFVPEKLSWWGKLWALLWAWWP